MSTAEDRVVLEIPGDAPALAALRATMRRWLGASAASDQEVTDITMATNEAVQNAIEHAHALTARSFQVELSREPGEVTVVIRDCGQWREGRSEDRGRGLPMNARADDRRAHRTVGERHRGDTAPHAEGARPPGGVIAAQIVRQPF
jgi:serine/threonine-protein kinase RsbW